MSKRNCSVYGCSNTEKNTKQRDPPVKFCCFPGTPWQTERKQKWISFVKRQQKDGSPWIPTKNSRICSEHFPGGRKNEHPHHPSFCPTILKKSHHLDGKGKVSRYERYSKRNCSVDLDMELLETMESPETGHRQHDKGTQVRMQIATETSESRPPSVWARYLTPCFEGVDSIHTDRYLRNLTGVADDANCFREKYGNCRVILDCTEIRTQTPGKVDQRIHMYSN